ncbi:glycosylceramide biosynthesis protein [Schizosaccharomyces japonicus yFS275]|uniref:Glycosylceramide biosynthesis protein n=1 Tax=Schizosaccharomyces japonicus (strain yFS275 / FY16936) TaxID=402676 RepID=B6K039_SCHJY|nr:glycosylceramide biosynthesis protein [Schizosaccharomyces japonicus yFS275]EEB06189.1 glycosylceramide biosynthesis protein [Schizosaccharomyces japonicus yFS275]
MAVAGKDVVIPARYIAVVHTILSFTAFIIPLALALSLHYKKVVKNEFYGYPEEWFPSVSATIGDWYPERSVFQFLIALTATPRLLVLLLWIAASGSHKKSVLFTAFVGLIRTAFCGGWVYVTSTDDHDKHDIFMIVYLVYNAPWFYLTSRLSPKHPMSTKCRRIGAGMFIGTVFPLIYWYIQHKFKQVPGAYTIYAFFEWTLILWDVSFDAAHIWDFKDIDLICSFGGPSGASVALNKKKSAQSDANAVPKESIFSVLGFFSETYMAFVFWSVFTSMGLLIWYFPLWHMGISGHEATIFVLLSPALLYFPFVRCLVSKVPLLFMSLSLVGVASYLVQDPANRLFTTGFAAGMGCLAWAGIFYNARKSRVALQSHITSFLLGLAASSVAKFSNFANNPIWPILHEENGGKNMLGLIVGTVSCFILLCTGFGKSIPTSEKRERPVFSLPIASLCLGTVLYGLHVLLCDSSTIILWNWSGYPVRGPLPLPHGLITIVTMIATIFLAPKIYRCRRLVLHGFSVFVSSAYLLHVRDGWMGYFAGLYFANYLIICFYAVMVSAVHFNPGAFYGLALFFYIIYALAHVWVVAYEFVPGGKLMRERTHFITAAVCFSISLVLVSYITRVKNRKGKAGKCSFTDFELSENEGKVQKKSFIKTFLVSLLLIASAIHSTVTLSPPYDYTPYHPEEKLFTAGIWTIHFGLDNFMWASERRMRDAFKDMELDIVGLLESDTQRLIGGFRDITQEIAHDLGMYADYGPGPNKHTWGAALLSKFPIINSTHHLLPSPRGELAPAIHATLDIYGEAIDVVVSHNGQYESFLDRRLQSTELGRIMRESPRPLVFLGYVVSNVGQEPQTLLTHENGMQDIEPSDWDRWCQYILYRGVKRVGYARLHRSTITDTELQTGKFVVTKEPARNVRVDASEVPAGYRYPDKFFGSGVRGHYYDNNNVVHEPWYYD